MERAREGWKAMEGWGDQGRVMRHMGVGEGYGKGGEDQGRGK